MDGLLPARDAALLTLGGPHQRSAVWPMFPIVMASGFAGLGYEIVWTRMLSVSLGTEMMAVLGVVAGIFGGFALGALLLDGPIRRARSPRLAYAVLETVIGLWGVASIVLLPAAGRILPPLLGTDPPPVLLWAAGFALPMLALLPATMAMGGTLAALDRMLSAAKPGARVAAGIYGLNTAGAVAGTLATAFVLTRAFGLSGTLAALAAVNLACALAALRLGPVASVASFPAHAAAASGVKPDGRARLAMTLFATGLLGVAFEVIVVRLAAQILQDTLYTFAGLLAAYLLGTAAGGLAWQIAGRRPAANAPAWLLAATALVGLGTAVILTWIAGPLRAPAAAGPIAEIGVAVALFVLPSAAMGAVFSHLAQAVRDRNGSLGWAVGVNALGAAVAPLLTAQVLIPAFGAWTALLPVSLAYLLLVPWRWRSLAWCALPAAFGLLLWVRPAPSLIRVPEGGALLAVREGPMSTASVVADASGVRFLEVNGHFRMGGTSSMRSDYRQAMLPLLLHPAPQTALFLGLGTGATLVGGAALPGVHVHGVELSPEVAALMPQFATPGAPPLPRITIADARRYVSAYAGSYDVIVADLYHPALDGSGALYTTEHFAAVRKILSSSGVFCQWLPLYQLDEVSLRTIIRSFLQIYPQASAWLNHYSVGTPMLALIGARGPVRIDPAALAVRLQMAAPVLQPLGLSQPIDLLGQYVGGAAALTAFAGAGPLNTDDYPAVALDAADNVRALDAPRAALLLRLIGAVHPDAASLLSASVLNTRVPTTGVSNVRPLNDGEPAADRAAWAPRLAALWQARDRFLQAGASLKGEPRGLALVQAAVPGLLDAVRLSPEFDPAYQPLLSMAQMLAASDMAAAMRLLQAIDNAAPHRDDARRMMRALATGSP